MPIAEIPPRIIARRESKIPRPSGSFAPERVNTTTKTRVVRMNAIRGAVINQAEAFMNLLFTSLVLTKNIPAAIEITKPMIMRKRDSISPDLII